MTKRCLLVLLALVTASGFGVVAAQQPGQLQAAKDAAKVAVDPGVHEAPYFTYTGKFYGFITDSKDLRKGYDITPDEVKKAVAGGARYVLYNNFPYFGDATSGRIEIEPQDKAAEFAGQQVWISGTVTTNGYGTGVTAPRDPTAARKFEGLQMTTISATTRDDAYADVKAPQGAGAGR